MGLLAFFCFCTALYAGNRIWVLLTGVQRSDRSNDKSSPALGPNLLLFVAGSVTALGIVPLYIFGWPTTANAFGGSFGFANTVVSSFALTGVIIAVYMQSKQLRMQQLELREAHRNIREKAESSFLTAYMNATSTVCDLSSQQSQASERIALIREFAIEDLAHMLETWRPKVMQLRGELLERTQRAEELDQILISVSTLNEDLLTIQSHEPSFAAKLIKRLDLILPQIEGVKDERIARSIRRARLALIDLQTLPQESKWIAEQLDRCKLELDAAVAQLRRQIDRDMS